MKNLRVLSLSICYCIATYTDITNFSLQVAPAKNVGGLRNNQSKNTEPEQAQNERAFLH